MKLRNSIRQGQFDSMDFGPYLLLASLEGAVQAAVLALTALGLSLVFGVMRVVNVAHGEFFMLGAVLAWWISSLLTGTPLFGFLAALIFAPLIVGGLAMHWLPPRAIEGMAERLKSAPSPTLAILLGVAFLLVEAVRPDGVAPFIYFQF